MENWQKRWQRVLEEQLMGGVCVCVRVFVFTHAAIAQVKGRGRWGWASSGASLTSLYRPQHRSREHRDRQGGGRVPS